MLQRKLLAGIGLALLGLSPVYADEPSTRGTVNSSVTITAGNTFQTVLNSVAMNNRRSLTIENNNTTDSCWVVVGGALASATKAIAILLLPGGSYTRYYPYIPSDAIHATCTSTSDTLYVDTQ